jgi:hypothetical protein
LSVEFTTPEQREKFIHHVTETAKAGVKQIKRQDSSLLGTLYYRKRAPITRKEYDAGCVLRDIMYRAYGSGCKIGSYTGVVCSGGYLPVPVRSMTAFKELREIAAAVGRAEYSLLQSFLWHDKTFGEIASEHQRDKDVVSRELREALGDLADYLKIK